MLRRYLSGLYLQAMEAAYGEAHRAIAERITPGAKVLDCGAFEGARFAVLQGLADLRKDDYTGVEWDAVSVARARAGGVDLLQGDLNKPLPFGDASFDCVFGLSVVEHLLMPCHFLVETRRVLKPGGRLVILTPNIATYFTAFSLLLGRMPSSGPHPDSNALQRATGHEYGVPDQQAEGDTPTHRHLIVFSYSVLMGYLKTIGFKKVRGRGFGHYPFPGFLQPILQKLDPWHCHQMVIVAEA